ncbi:hypothetical protein ES705_39858 [subsurface metagenome]|jgi:hypothetical protein
MSVKRPVDVLDWRGDRAAEIVSVIRKLPYRIVILGDGQYDLGPYELIRLANILCTSNNIKRSLDGLRNLIRRREKVYLDQAKAKYKEKHKK